ncbi:type I glutamate--ammonia ligase [Microaerobacter geothermalis]|uniref:type I glutamate--ammonia ligase n=1 Tax=Microaerobacter geothermalis TaxID=674972 RepID=UPI001F2AB476|nr:type I glutamate--ammonia ligase [Microaerobacter geothermalis]MCF6093782.1 type I glutamate--ammonia ligase [Microaerobacter geothermalis]
MMLLTELQPDSKKQLIWEKVKENQIQFIRLQFTDIFGFAKNVAITTDELDKALNGELMFDGSSIDGFARIEESDMYLMPDPDTFQPITWRPDEKGVAYMFCDVYTTDGKPFEGCPRNILKRALNEAKEMGYTLNVGPEGEFFLFYTDEKGRPVFDIHDDAGYFDLSPVDKGEDARRDIILTMRKLGFSIEASHHEVAPGQHEVDFKYDEALRMADKWMIFKQIVKNIAQAHGLYASFIPKPFSGQNGNAMHCNQSLVKDGINAFFDENDERGLSEAAHYYIGGLLTHAKGMAAICNPTINSYKRLLPGYEAPTNIAWSASNRSALIRIPIGTQKSTRIELRNPDPTANPYLVFAVMLKAGLEGIKKKMTPPPAVDKNIYDMNSAERNDYQIQRFPRSLQEALDHMEQDPLMKETLGEHTFYSYLNAKRKEWEEYAEEVHTWEIRRYLKQY